MYSILEQLLELTRPLFAAVVSGKKRTQKKSAKKRAPAKPKRVTRFKPKKSAARAKRTATHKSVKSKPSASKRIARKPFERKTSAQMKKGAMRPMAASKPETRKGFVPPKPEPKIVVPPPPPPKPVRPAGRPILLSPENGKYADSVNPKYRWLSVGGATRYEVIWSQDSNLINGYSIVSAATEAAVPVEKPLAIGVTSYLACARR